MIHYLFFINGLYDILCALCILHMIDIPVLSELHLTMFKTKQSALAERYLAYWIFTYGVIRMSGDNHLISYSYFIEALFFLNEYYIHDALYDKKAWFVIITSIFFGAAAAVQKN